MQSLNEYLQIADERGKRVIRCKCGYTLGPASDNYKAFALKAESPIQKAGPNVNPCRVGNDKFVFREFCCPGCSTLLGTEIALKGAPLLWDIQL